MNVECDEERKLGAHEAPLSYIQSILFPESYIFESMSSIITQFASL